MKYGNKRKYKCQKCGRVGYYHGDSEDKRCVDCDGTMKDIELHLKCPSCKNTIKRESGDSWWKCKACGHKELVR